MWGKYYMCRACEWRHLTLVEISPSEVLIRIRVRVRVRVKG